MRRRALHQNQASHYSHRVMDDRHRLLNTDRWPGVICIVCQSPSQAIEIVANRLLRPLHCAVYTGMTAWSFARTAA